MQPKTDLSAPIKRGWQLVVSSDHMESDQLMNELTCKTWGLIGRTLAVCLNMVHSCSCSSVANHHQSLTKPLITGQRLLAVYWPTNRLCKIDSRPDISQFILVWNHYHANKSNAHQHMIMIFRNWKLTHDLIFFTRISGDMHLPQL